MTTLFRMQYVLVMFSHSTSFAGNYDFFFPCSRCLELFLDKVLVGMSFVGCLFLVRRTSFDECLVLTTLLSVATLAAAANVVCTKSKNKLTTP